MAYGSAAIAHDADGKTLFVNGGAPGDMAKVRIIGQKANYAHADIEELLEPSPLRTSDAPVCTHTCGGCPWAHLSYEAQCAAKRDNVIDALVRIGHMDAARADELTESCIPSKRQWGYRNKLELATFRDEQG